MQNKENTVNNLVALYSSSRKPGVSGFAERQLISRITAVAAGIFSLALLAPKVAAGAFALSASAAYGLKTRKWSNGILTPSAAKSFLTTCLFSCISPVRIIIAILHPHFFAKKELSAQCAIDHQSIAKTHLATMTPEELDNNWKLQEFFGSIRFINLDRSPQRRESIINEMAGIGLHPGDYERHAACDGKREVPKSCYDRVNSNYKRISTDTPEGREKLDNQHKGQAGCYMSHYTLIRDISNKYDDAVKTLETLSKSPTTTPEELNKAKAEVKKYSSVLIFEDDDFFGTITHRTCNDNSPNRYFSDSITKSGTGSILRNAMKNLPKDWDMLYFMALNDKPPKATSSPVLGKLQSAVGLTAYAVHAKMYHKILDLLSKIERQEYFLPVDDEIASLHPTSNCFVIHPPIVSQPGEESDINGVAQSNNKDKKFWQCSYPPE